MNAIPNALPRFPGGTRHLKKALGSLLAAWGLTCSGLAQAQAPLQADVKPTCTVAAPTFASWFKAGSVSLNGEVNPANSVTFPNIPNCSFYQWSEQMFLWLNSPTPPSYGGGGGRIFESPAFYDVSGLDADFKRTYIPNRAGISKLFNVRSSQVGPNGLQTINDSRGKLFEVLPAPIGPNGKSMIRNSAGKLTEIQSIQESAGKKLTFLDDKARKIAVPAAPKLDTTLAQRVSPHLLKLSAPMAKNMVQGFRSGPNGRVFFLDSAGNQVTPTQGQAGDSAVLLAQNGSLVYYTTMVNDVYAFFQTGTKNGAIKTTPGNTTPTQFPTTQAELDKVVAYAQTKGKTFPDAEALAIEVKASWIEPTGLDTSKYITARAAIPVYNKSNPALWIPTTATHTVTLAMVGMHVVGSTKGHPEMIWATFEHFSNTPWATFTYTNTANQTKTVTQAASGTWLFSSTNNPAANYNFERMTYVSGSITAVSATLGIGPSDTIRWKTWGSASDLNPTASNTEVMAINNSVIGQLAAGDIRRNYMMTGATWTIGGQAPINDFANPTNTVGANQVGTNHLANTTMETYQQGINPQKNGTNCFTCHSSNKVGVSHIFNSLKPLYP